VIASVRTGDFSWQGNGLAHDPSTEILPANW
jgi:hypothetical protein